MIELPIYQVDAFTSELFGGNPAAVVPLESWLEDTTLQAVAAENNLAETAFLVPSGTGFELRWFTPTVEVRLCGHATLASAFVLFEELGWSADEIRFETQSGTLGVRREGTRLTLQFPVWRLESAEAPAALTAGLGSAPVETFIVDSHDNYFAVYADERGVASITPDFGLLEQLHPAGVIVTAPGRDSDCVCRYFAPSYGIPEDSATGSIHCALAPFWSQRLGLDEIRSRQLSRRGAEFLCSVRGDATLISGHCVKYLEGRIRVG
jgi:PhzF family phenazine biosynthesis protein